MLKQSLARVDDRLLLGFATQHEALVVRGSDRLAFLCVWRDPNVGHEQPRFTWYVGAPVPRIAGIEQCRVGYFVNVLRPCSLCLLGRLHTCDIALAQALD